MVTKYQKKISGPLIERIDIHVEVPWVQYEKLSGATGESREKIQARVETSRRIQRERFAGVTPAHNMVCNADMRVGKVRKFCHLEDEGQSLMRAAMAQMNLSARAYHRTRSVKLGRTIADLAGSNDIQSAHLAAKKKLCRWSRLRNRCIKLGHCQAIRWR